MVYPEKEVRLKDGRMALLRSPCEEDAAQMLQFIIQASGETEFLMRYPEEWADYTLEKERGILRECCNDENREMIACILDGRIVGNCQIVFRTGMKEMHRASTAVAILQEFWGHGIGTLLFEEMIRLAQARGGIRQLELAFIEGNTRARGLYEKMGFRITGVEPDAIRLKDGTFVNEYLMVKKL